MSKEHHGGNHKEHHSAHGHGASDSKLGKILGFEARVIVLLAVLVIGTAIVATYFGVLSGENNALTKTKTVSVDTAVLGSKIADYINNNLLPTGVTVAIKDSNDLGNGLYSLSFELSQGGQVVQAGTLYATKEKIILGQAFDLNTPIQKTGSQGTGQTADAAPVKSDKPVAELYIFSYCPAGTAALDSFAKAASALKDVADVKVKFFSNMHGSHELQQNQIQECIQLVDKAKYWDYAQQFVANIYPVCGQSRSVDCDKNESTKLMNSLGIDSKAVFDCVATKGSDLYKADIANATSLSLQYSPSVVVNGVYFGNVDRSPEGLKTKICESFNSAPAVCDVALGNKAATSSGSCGS